MDWVIKRVLDANVWLASGKINHYRIIEKDQRLGHYLSQERSLDYDEFITFMTSNTLSAAKSAAEAMNKNS